MTGRIISVGSSPPWDRLRQREEGILPWGAEASTTMLAGTPDAPRRMSRTVLTAKTTTGKRRSKTMVLMKLVFLVAMNL